MPVYDYLCGRCGAFTEDRPMRESGDPQPCPTCGDAAPRAILSAPRLAGLSSELRFAHAANERSAHAPRVADGHRHGPGCGCGGAPKKTRPAAAAKGFPSRRPWMISH